MSCGDDFGKAILLAYKITRIVYRTLALYDPDSFVAAGSRHPAFSTKTTLWPFSGFFLPGYYGFRGFVVQMIAISRLAWFKIGRAALLAMLLVVAAEVSLRFIFGLGSPVLYVPDKGNAEGGYGYSPAPDQNVWRFFSRNKINHFSMRSEDVGQSKGPDRLRVLFIGDSVAYGTTYIDQSRIFTTLVSHGLPKKAGHPVDVLNASAGGWAPANEIGFLKKRGTFDADLVLIVLNTADLNQPFADLPPDPGFPTEAPWTAIGETWTRYLAPRLLGARGPASDPGSTALQPANMVEETGAVLKTLGSGQAYALAHHARFGVVYIPSHGKLWNGAAFQMGKAMLLDWARQHEVPLIDLTQDFEGHSLDELYLERGDTRIHLAAAAHRIVAARLLSSIPAILYSQKGATADG